MTIPLHRYSLLLFCVSVVLLMMAIPLLSREVSVTQVCPLKIISTVECVLYKVECRRCSTVEVSVSSVLISWLLRLWGPGVCGWRSCRLPRITVLSLPRTSNVTSPVSGADGSLMWERWVRVLVLLDLPCRAHRLSERTRRI